MGLNAAIDVAIGLILMYLVLSLLCTVINEYISTILKWRSASLAQGLGKILDDPTLKQAFYDHGLIAGTNAASNAPLKNLDDGHPSYLSGRTFAMALVGSLDPTKPVPVFSDVEDAIRTLPDSNIRDVLLSHVVEADKDVTKLREGLATWFDDTMERLGGTYKRKLKTLALVIGFIVAAAINADSVRVGNALWHDSALREQLVQSSGHIVSSTAQDLQKNIAATESVLRPLPVGWSETDFDNFATKLPLKFFGLLITAIALSLGAPFWFDLLSKFMKIRGTGDKPSRADSAQTSKS